MPIAQRTNNININGNEHNTSKEGKLLRLRIQTTGIVGHSTNTKNKANAVLTKLRRFTNLTPRIK